MGKRAPSALPWAAGGGAPWGRAPPPTTSAANERSHGCILSKKNFPSRLTDPKKKQIRMKKQNPRASPVGGACVKQLAAHLPKQKSQRKNFRSAWETWICKRSVPSYNMTGSRLFSCKRCDKGASPCSREIPLSLRVPLNELLPRRKETAATQIARCGSQFAFIFAGS